MKSSKIQIHRLKAEENNLVKNIQTKECKIDIMNTNYYRSRLALFRPICVEKPRPSPGYAYASRLDRTKNCGVYPL